MTTTTTRETPQPRANGQPASDETSGIRLAAAAGVAFVVLSVASTFSAGSPPASDASAAKIASYFHDHSGGIKAQLLLGGCGIVALMWWFGALWRMLNRAERQPRLSIVATVAFAIGSTLALLNGTVVATAAIRVNDVATTHLFYSFSLVAISAAGFGIGTFLLATNTVTYRARITPVWVSGLGFVAAIAFLGSSLGVVTDSAAVFALGLIAFFVWCVWILAVSVIMWRSASS
jgi:hypothetical protein